MKILIMKTLATLLLICVKTFASNFPPIIKTQSGSTIQEAKEDKPIGTKLFNITAQDRNGGSVTIKATGVACDIVTINLIQSGSYTTGEVLLKKTLDREAQSSLQLRFIAISSNKDAPSSALEVTLFVNDVDDEPPQFSQPAYHVLVPENHSLTEAIDASISATDPDNTPEGSFYMQPNGQVSALYGDTFTIDEINGKLYLNKSLDFERLTFYQYILIAKDGGNPRLNSTADLLITILDVQDTPPVFIGLPDMVSVQEELPMEYLITKAFAVDGDLGIPNNISYSLETGECASFVRINAVSGGVYTQKILDRDRGLLSSQNGLCSITVKASEITDSPSNVSQSTAVLILSVQDINDNAPIFDETVYQGYVQEGMTDIDISIPRGVLLSDTDQVLRFGKSEYCGIVIVRWRPIMFVDFVGNQYPRIYIPRNYYFVHVLIH